MLRHYPTAAEVRANLPDYPPENQPAVRANVPPAHPFSAFDLAPGMHYEVKVPFKDFDGQLHPVGERFRYESRNYLPYDAGMTLNVSDAGAMTSIRLQDYPEAQGAIIDRFSEFVKMASDQN